MDDPIKRAEQQIADGERYVPEHLRPGLREACGVPPAVRQSILQEAEAIVNGPRQSLYGDPVENYEMLAEVLSALLGIKITARKAAVLMAALKIVREFSGPGTRDNRVDGAGYLEIADRCAEEADGG